MGLALDAIDGPETLVQLAYRSVLRREPDVGGLARYAAALRDGQDLAWLLRALSASDEFRIPAPAPPPFPLDSAPPMAVDAACSPAALQAMWDHVAATWSGMGEAEPHWSVLTDDRFRADALDADALALFHESGEEEVRRFRAWLARAGWTPPADGVCAEFGCGVGRITRSLAREFGRVIGVDVSAPHLRAARAQLVEDGIGNVDLVALRGPGDLAALGKIDVFYSVISLQHSPPPIILDVLGHAFASLRPGGCAFFQVPTYAREYAYPPGWIEPPGRMEMHFVPQREVLALAQRHGLTVAEVQPDWCVGRPGEWISSTFLLLKSG